MADDGSTAYRFEQIYLEELESIAKRRRAWRRPTKAEPNDESHRQVKLPLDYQGEDAALDRAIEEAAAGNRHDAQAQALDANLCGLAISGGGIRSATFAFGVLQGLAVAGLLPRFDYLSTVSGGGYIGSWWSAWIQRAGFDVVERQLQPPRFRQTGSEEVEPEAIRHLRLYSNYLAPRPGLFSLDGWVLIAIYLRNLLVNQLVLLLATLSLLVGVRFFVELFSLAHDERTGTWMQVALMVLSVTALLVALRGVSNCLPFPVRSLAPRQARYIWHDGVGPLVASAILLAALATLQVWHSSLETGAGNALAILGCCLVMGLWHAALGASALGLRHRGFATAFGLLAGAVAGLLLYGVWQLLATVADHYEIHVAATVVFGPPVVMLCMLFAHFLHVGFMDELLKEPEREWWSALNARVLMVAAGWLLLFGLAVFGPWAVMQLVQKSNSWGEWLTGLLGAGWLATVIAGLRAAYSAKTAGKRGFSFAELLASIAPFVFLVGVFLLLAILVNWIAYDVYAFGDLSDGRFASRVDYLLTDLETYKTWDEDGWWPVWPGLLLASLFLYYLSHLLGQRIGVNTFSLQNLYANRLARCYLGASRKRRNPEPLTNFDPRDDLPLAKFSGGRLTRNVNESRYFGPLHLINGALNRKAGDAVANRHGDAIDSKATAESLAFLDRKAESWVFTPQYCGSETTGYRPTEQFANNVKVSTAVAVSGAAVSPNMGFHSSPAITMLLTVFNVRLGAWFENPRQAPWPNAGFVEACRQLFVGANNWLKRLLFGVQAEAAPLAATKAMPPAKTAATQKAVARQAANPPATAKLLFDELMGRTKAESEYVYVSDGGHFENLGVYELLRRRCRFIVVVDAGADPTIHENVGHLIRKARIDLGVRIDVDMQPVTPTTGGKAAAHLVIGRIHYGDVHRPLGSLRQAAADPNFMYEDNQGVIVWLKNSLVGDEPGDVANFCAMNPEFPFETTLDQFFSEPQFESYRALGVITVYKTLENIHFPGRSQYEDYDDREFKLQQKRSPAADRGQVGKLRAATSSYEYSDVKVTFGSPKSGTEASTLAEYPTLPLFRTLFDYWLAKPPQFAAAYIAQNDGYSAMVERLRTDPALSWLAKELYGSLAEKEYARQHTSVGDEARAERLMVAEMLVLLENTWFALSLERHQYHPVHAGWMQVFDDWLRAKHVSDYWDDQQNAADPGNAWTGLKHEFSPVFQRFVDRVRERAKTP